MELQEQVNALEAEKKQLSSSLERVNAERFALDNSYIKALREVQELKVDIILKDKMLRDFNDQIQGLLKEKQDLLAKLESPVSAE